METITISKKEYNRLKEAEKRLIPFNTSVKSQKARKKFDITAFGMWKNNFGKESSVAYVNRIRKEWR